MKNDHDNNKDHRSFLLRRLNDWLSDFYQNRPRISEQSNLRNLRYQTEQGATSMENTNTTYNNFDLDYKNIDFKEDKKKEKQDSSDSGEESSKNNLKDAINTNK